MAIKVFADGTTGFLQCDRCGTHILEGKVNICANVDMIHVRKERGYTIPTSKYSGVREVDTLGHWTLCQECAEDFDEWVKGGKPDGNR